MPWGRGCGQGAGTVSEQGHRAGASASEGQTGFYPAVLECRLSCLPHSPHQGRYSRGESTSLDAVTERGWVSVPRGRRPRSQDSALAPLVSTGAAPAPVLHLGAGGNSSAKGGSVSAGSCCGPRGRQAWGRCPGDSSDATRLTAASCVSRELRSAGLDRRLQGELALVHSRLWSLRLSLGPGVRLDLPCGGEGRAHHAGPAHPPLGSPGAAPAPRAQQPQREGDRRRPAHQVLPWTSAPQEGPLPLPSGWSGTGASCLRSRVDTHGRRGDVLH